MPGAAEWAGYWPSVFSQGFSKSESVFKSAKNVKGKQK